MQIILNNEHDLYNMLSIREAYSGALHDWRSSMQKRLKEATKVDIKRNFTRVAQVASSLLNPCIISKKFWRQMLGGVGIVTTSKNSYKIHDRVLARNFGAKFFGAKSCLTI